MAETTSRFVCRADAPRREFHLSALGTASRRGGSTFLESFKDNLDVKIVSKTDERVEFDLINADAAIVNAFRRVLIAEVPTMAIETVYVTLNTSIMQDEVLAHRLVSIKKREGEGEDAEARSGGVDAIRAPGCWDKALGAFSCACLPF